jgi:hypothetical protein
VSQFEISSALTRNGRIGVRVTVARVFSILLAYGVAAVAIICMAGIAVLAATWGYNLFIIVLLLLGLTVCAATVALAVALTKSLLNSN